MWTSFFPPWSASRTCSSLAASSLALSACARLHFPVWLRAQVDALVAPLGRQFAHALGRSPSLEYCPRVAHVPRAATVSVSRRRPRISLAAVRVGDFAALRPCVVPRACEMGAGASQQRRAAAVNAPVPTYRLPEYAYDDDLDDEASATLVGAERRPSGAVGCWTGAERAPRGEGAPSDPACPCCVAFDTMRRDWPIERCQ